MTVAIFGLLGVVVGGVLNGIVAWQLELARRARAARAGARLVRTELAELASSYSWAGIVGWQGIGELPSGEWANHRALLAEALTSDEFKTVSAAYAAGKPLRNDIRR